MPSPNDLDHAQKLAIQFVEADEKTKRHTMLGVAEVYEADTYEIWCHLGGSNQSPDAEERYSIYNTLFVVLWRTLGTYEFFMRLDAALKEIKMLRTFA